MGELKALQKGYKAKIEALTEDLKLVRKVLKLQHKYRNGIRDEDIEIAPESIEKL